MPFVAQITSNWERDNHRKRDPWNSQHEPVGRGREESHGDGEPGDQDAMSPRVLRKSDLVYHVRA